MNDFVSEKNIKKIKESCLTNYKFYQTKVDRYNNSVVSLTHVVIFNKLQKDKQLIIMLRDNLTIMRYTLNLIMICYFFRLNLMIDIAAIISSVVFFSHNNLFMNLTPHFIKFDIIYIMEKYIDLKTNDLTKERNPRFIILYFLQEIVNVFGFFYSMSMIMESFINIRWLVNLISISFFSIISVSSILKEMELCKIPESIEKFIDSYVDTREDSILHGITKVKTEDIDRFDTTINESISNECRMFEVYRRLYCIKLKNKQKLS